MGLILMTPPRSVMKLQSGSNNEPPDPGAQERLSMGDRSGTETSPDSMMIQENEQSFANSNDLVDSQ